MRCRLLHTVSFIALSAFPLAGCRTVAADAAPAAVGQKAALTAAASELPTPPQQNAPWSSPTGADASGFSPELIAAVPTLFAQGLADPRSGAYQSITVEVGDVWSGRGRVAETHGWVFPAANGAKRFAVCWNGLVYPVVSSKGSADLQADVENAVKPFQNHQNGGISAFQNNPTLEQRGFSLDFPSLMQVALLLRASKPNLARQINAVWEARMPPRTNGNDEIRRDPYGYLARHWVWAAYDRAVCAHMRGADALVLADSDLLTRALPAINTEIAKRNYKSYPNGGVYTPPAPYFGFLQNLPELQSDAARRVSEAPRPPLDLPALQKLPQKQRIAALVARLDEVAARQSGQPGGVGLDEDPVTQALIKEGDAAVEPLLDTIETDTRLTRSVSFSRDFHQDRNLLSVKDAAFVCFVRITGISEIRGEDGVKRSAASLKEWWAKNRRASPGERWLMQLADEGAAPPIVPQVPGQNKNDWQAEREASQKAWERSTNTVRRWEEAAKRIVERTDISRTGQWVTQTKNVPGKPLPPFKGEDLRGYKNPSVSDLLCKRALQLSDVGQAKWGYDYVLAANFALMLYEWEPTGPQTLPTLQEVMRRCLARENAQKKENSEDQEGVGGRIARLTLARIYLKDTSAAADYEKYLRSVPLRYVSGHGLDNLFPLWKEPENPALRRVADTLFAANPPAGAPSPWSRLLADPKEPSNFDTGKLFHSDLLRLASFRALVLRRLADTTPAGTVTQNVGKQKWANFVWYDGSQGGPSLPPSDVSVKQTMRICDRTAMELKQVSGAPLFDPIAPLDARNKACVALAAYLKKWGRVLGDNPNQNYYHPLFSYDMGSAFDYMGPAFEQRGRPASSNDVKENRAIFNLTGKTRVAPDLPTLPLEAEWEGDPNADITAYSDGKTIKQARHSFGLPNQAEDKWDGKKWVRFFGYVGPHSIAKVPADQIRITDYRARVQKTPSP